MNLFEKETTINFNCGEQSVSIFTRDGTVANRCKRYGWKLDKVAINNKGVESSWSFLVDKKIFRWGKKRQSNLTDEQKRIRRDALRARIASKVL